MFKNAAALVAAFGNDTESVLRPLIHRISLMQDRVTLELDPTQLGFGENSSQIWKYETPLPKKKPFREAKLRIDNASDALGKIDDKLVGLMANAIAVQKLVLASPDVPLHKIAKREGRCRKKLTQLVKLSWISPRIVEAIIEGRQPSKLSRKRLMETDLPLAWADQERLLGFGG